jgi:hypothetical protein
MSIGDGIFWGALVLGVVALFLGTKDRWSWKKIAARSLFGLIGLGTLIAAGLFVSDWYQQRPQVLQEFWGIPSDATPADVLFLKGEPKSRDSEDEWLYLPSEGLSVMVQFRQGKVKAVLCFGDRLHLPKFGNVSPYATREGLLKRYGEPSAITTSADGLVRTYNFRPHNLVVAFQQDGIVGGGMDSSLETPRTYGARSKSAASAASASASK